MKAEGSPSLAIFVERLAGSGLVTASEYQAFCEAMPAASRPRTAEQLAREMHRQGLLTPFQSQALYQGKTRGLVLDKYVVLDRVGEDDAGQVYKARDKETHREVALRVLPSSLARAQEAIERISCEVQTAAGLSHPNIVSVYEVGESRGVHFLLMEYVEGQSLDRVVRTQGPLSVAVAVDCVLQAARGLEYAHQHKVIHRGLRPSSLLLDNQGRIRILDMGLTRIAEFVEGVESATSEQASRGADVRTDIYCLGCTLGYLLTGCTPFGGNVIEGIPPHEERPVLSLRSRRPEVPESLEIVYRKMLAWQPEGRQQSMAELMAELERCELPVDTGGYPIVVPAVSLLPPALTEDRPPHINAEHRPKPFPRSFLLQGTTNRQRIALGAVAGVAFLLVFWATIRSPRTPSLTMSEAPLEKREQRAVGSASEPDDSAWRAMIASGASDTVANPPAVDAQGESGRVHHETQPRPRFTASSVDFNRFLERAYEAKFHNSAWINRMNRGALSSRYDDSDEERLIKDARAELSRRIMAPSGQRVRSIPVVVRPPIVLDGLMSEREWDRAIQIPTDSNGRKTTLFLLSDGSQLYIACDVPEETSPADFAQFRFYIHVLTSPLIVNERVHLDGHRCVALRQTTVTWQGDSPTDESQRWKRYPITDWNVYQRSQGATQCVGHRQYEMSMNLAECGLYRGVPFPAFIEVEGPSKRNADGAFVQRTYLGKLGTQGTPAWFVIQPDAVQVAQLKD